MAQLNWKFLPKAAREHLSDSVRTRAITADDLLRLQEWIVGHPEVPEGEIGAKTLGLSKSLDMDRVLPLF